ncbi:hypothetical protein SVA_1359 [Sulfurifustis variabilis]|uniref:Uncharacterized protein n=1 Tax=Sulfurifustis variabilis TaxID=1675686 RepID=A0A1B4V2Z8_9GAMM|nr:hypothetical protein SVA_1359 [Sulfurifustis variabilis]
MPPPVSTNAAVTPRAAVMRTVQSPVPEQLPDQPAKAKPGDGVAESVTELPAPKSAVQLLPQSIPAGWETTCPLPESVTFNSCVPGGGVSPVPPVLPLPSASLPAPPPHPPRNASRTPRTRVPGNDGE